ncbi:CHAT domain-containing protein [Allokutzneria albata]|uniref:CHAT domain-containing protein n=1 Tax=Allokutzneria albata TaxID=211114 RepID=A0A1G9UDA1_ALLAB|nr:CHAT domain-containing protein [Allokutzneria albata]SDM57947.1 CHAT domain-containing protein [Allokutzneria albata]
MRLSRDLTGWAFLAEVDGARKAGLAIGHVEINPFTSGDGAGGSLFTRAHAWGMPALRSLDELPFGDPVDSRWCVLPDDRGVLSVRAPDGEDFAYDLDVEGPPGWREAASADGSVMLVVSHVLPSTDDPLSALVAETKQGLVCASPVSFGEPVRDAGGQPTATFYLDPVGRLLDLANYVRERILSLDEAKRRARDLEQVRQELAEHHELSAEAMVDLLFRDEFLDDGGLVETMYVYWRLVAEVADESGVVDAWRVAALRTVETAVPLMAQRCDRAVFEEADALSTRLLAELSEPTDLEAALLAAARLRVATRGPEEHAADTYAHGLRTTWAARLEADLYRSWFTEEEPFQKESHRLVVEAAHLVTRALKLEGGTRRPRLLALLAQILADEAGVHQDAAGGALEELLDSPELTEPDLALFLLRVVDGVPPDVADGLLTAVFGTPLADFVAAYGRTTASKVISQGVNLARERADEPLLRTVLGWADQLEFTWDPAHRRQLIEARSHVLPEEALRDDASEEVALLTADRYYHAANTGEPLSGPVPFPWGYYTYAALGYASLGFVDLALASLVPVAQQVGNLRGEELKGAVHAIIVDLPNFDGGGAPELGELLRDIVHSAVWQFAAECESLPMGLMLGLHQAGKGPELGAWWRIDGPISLPAHIQHFVGKLLDLEEPGAAGASQNLLGVLDADGRLPGDDDAQVARNLRWRISSFIDTELRRRSTALIDSQHLWARAHALLDDRTVLLTWFLPVAVRGAAVLLAVTRQGRSLVVHLGDGEENRDRHPVADEIEAIRAEIQRDPLFGDVTPEGARLLDLGTAPLGGDDLWARWRAQGKDRLLVWPHGALHYLPIPLCRTGDRMIADDWTVTAIAGLEALAPVEVPARQRRTVVLASASGGVPYGLPAEPVLEEHAREVADAVGAHAATGSAATRARLLAELSTVDVVHIAAHGTMDVDAPWLHCLYLSPDSDDDGRVFAHDFLAADLRGVRLVTLAACESALGRFDHGDNIRGIPSALITAGAQAVVGCLWPVRPEPATYFYHHMHDRIGRGADPVRAFRDAQLATRARYSHYRDWAAFTYLQGRSKGATA